MTPTNFRRSARLLQRPSLFWRRLRRDGRWFEDAFDYAEAGLFAIMRERRRLKGPR